MSNINLIDSFQEFKDFKNIDRPTMMSVLEDVFRSMIRKKYGTDENCDVIVNTDNGDLEIWRTRKVMEDGFSEDDDLEIELTEAKVLDPSLEVAPFGVIPPTPKKCAFVLAREFIVMNSVGHEWQTISAHLPFAAVQA